MISISEKKLAEKRLTEAYNNAKIEYFDNHSKYIFFSDCHRGDCTPSDEFAKNQNVFLFALEFYFNNGYTYVELGDGDVPGITLLGHRQVQVAAACQGLVVLGNLVALG